MIPKELINAIKENNLVLFVGAGLSCNLINKDNKQIGTWYNLVKQIINHIEKDKPKVECLKSLVDNYTPIDILDLIEKLGEDIKLMALDFLVNFYDLSDNNNFVCHNKLCGITKKIITTNYDNAFEKAETEIDSDKIITIDNNKGINYLHNNNEFTLLKLHGCITNKDKIVVFPSDYKNLYENKDRNAESMLFYLQNMIFSKTILFIGSGLGDFQIRNIFSKVQNLLGIHNTKKHYIISKDNPKLDFLEHIPIETFDDINIIIDKLYAIKIE